MQPSVEPALPAGRATIQDPSATLVVQRGSGAAPAVSGELAATAVSSFASVDELAQPGVLQFPAASTTAPATHEAARVSEDAGASEDSGVATAPSARALSPPALVAPALVASPVTDPHAAPGSAARSPDVAIDAGAAATAGRAMVDHPAFDRDEPPRTIVGSPHPPGDTSSTVPSAAGPG